MHGASLPSSTRAPNVPAMTTPADGGNSNPTDEPGAIGRKRPFGFGIAPGAGPAGGTGGAGGFVGGFLGGCGFRDFFFRVALALALAWGRMSPISSTSVGKPSTVSGSFSDGLSRSGAIF